MQLTECMHPHASNNKIKLKLKNRRWHVVCDLWFEIEFRPGWMCINTVKSPERPRHYKVRARSCQR